MMVHVHKLVLHAMNIYREESLYKLEHHLLTRNVYTSHVNKINVFRESCC